MSKSPRAKPASKSFADSKFVRDIRTRAIQRKLEFEVAERVAKLKPPSPSSGAKDFVESLSRISGVLTLNQCEPDDHLMLEVFEFCDLDPADPWHWRLLLEVTLAVAFKKSGAHEKWNEASYFNLFLNIRKLKKLYPLADTNGKIAAILRKKSPFKAEFEGVQLSYLTKLVGRACDPRFNPMADCSDNDDFIEDLVRKRSELPNGSPEVARLLVDKLIDSEIEEGMNWLQEQFEAEGMTWTAAEREALLPTVSDLVRKSLARTSE